MNTKYGKLPNEVIVASLKRLVGKVYKILPMREEKCETLDEYVGNLLRELINHKELVESLKYEEELMSLINTLEGLKDNELEFSVFRSDVLKSLGIIKKMIGNIEGGKTK